MGGKPVARADASTGSLPLGPSGVRSLLNCCHLPMAQGDGGGVPGWAGKGAAPRGLSPSSVLSQPWGWLCSLGR